MKDMISRSNILLWIVIVLLFLTADIFAQTGRVVEIKNAKRDTIRLSDVLIYLKRINVSTYSDSVGNFIMDNIKTNDTLDVFLTGYTKQKFIVKNVHERFTIVLKQAQATELQEVEIIYQRPSIEYSVINPLQVQTLNENYLQKAACCNLSESFETNASIDVQITDAITGLRQIQLLGLAGKYALLTKENIPFLWGIQSSQGLSFIPGPFVQSIQLSKGVGSVVNGYESFTGQINTELWNPRQAPFKLYFNTYVNENARNEYNLIINQKLNHHLSTNFLIHNSFNPLAQDMNHDGFVDIPTGKQFNIINKYELKTEKGLDWQWGGQMVINNTKAGQIMNGFNYTEVPYIVTSQTKRYDLFSKSGFIFRSKPGHSIGLQLMYSYYDNQNAYGANYYNALQQSFYGNLIYQGILGTTAHSYKLGTSFNWIKPNETYRYFTFTRNEQIMGGFAEYSFIPNPHFSLLTGLRLDYHNYYGFIFTPRIHLKYSFNNQNSVIKLSFGKAQRTPNPLSDNIGVMASNRLFYFSNKYPLLPYGLQLEKAFNTGINFYHSFKLFYRPASILLEYYYTYFINQVVNDMDSVNSIKIYNANGNAYAHNAQAELKFQPIKRLETTLAFKYSDNQTYYMYGKNLIPYISPYRAYVNFAYTTRDKKWQADATMQYYSPKRLPNTTSYPLSYQRSAYSPDYLNVLSQVTYNYTIQKSEWAFYIGVENLLNVKQHNPIVAASSPSSPYFDASMVWGPIYGSMFYAGIRYKLK